MSVTCLKWREPIHDACILVGLIDGGTGGVVAPYWVVAVGIVVAEANRLYVCCLGHDALSKISVVCRNDRRMCSVNGRFTKLFCDQS